MPINKIYFDHHTMQCHIGEINYNFILYICCYLFNFCMLGLCVIKTVINNVKCFLADTR